MRRLAASLALVALLVPATAAHAADPYDPQRLLSDEDLTDTVSMTRRELDDLFAHGSLAAYRTKDVNGVTRSAADIVWRAAQAFGINPQFLAVLLQREQSLVEDPHPSQDQLDWAMGFSVCDSCSKSDPRLAKYKGFGPQVYYAAQKIGAAYLADLRRGGRTQSGLGVGIPASIDGRTIVPQTRATAVLYTYTPHLHGNENFVRIWNRWFVPEYPSGTLLQDAKTGGVYLIRNGLRYPLASKTVLATSFAGRPVLRATAGTLASYPVGATLRYPNYSLLRGPDGGVCLVVDDTVRAFATPDLVKQIGFDPSEVTDVSAAELEAYVPGPPIESAAVNPHVRLVQDTASGGVFAVTDGAKHPILSPEILKARFGGRSIFPALRGELEALPAGAPVTFPDGVLIAARGGKEVYVVSDGMRRHVVDETALAAYGWSVKQVIWTDRRSLELQPEGTEIRRPEDNAAPDLTAASLP